MALKYNRTFMALKNDRAGYGTNNRMPSGRCIIETRGGTGKLSLMVQDLKANVYKCYIINNGDNKSVGVSVGTLVSDAKGKGELRFEFDANDVGGSMLSVEGFNVVAIMVRGAEDMIVPLVGYRNDEVRWKNNFVDFAENKSVIEEKKMEEFKMKEPEIEAPTPVSEELKVEKPVWEETAVQETIQEAMLEETVFEEQVVEEPVYEKPVYEEPVFEKPLCEEPILEKPASEWSVFEKPIFDDPVYIEPVIQQAVEDNSAETVETEALHNISFDLKEEPEDSEPDWVVVQKESSGENIESVEAENVYEEIEESIATDTAAPEQLQEEVYAKESDFFENINMSQPLNHEDSGGEIHETFKAMAQKFNKELAELEHLAFLSEEEMQMLQENVPQEEKINIENISGRAKKEGRYGIEDELDYLFQNNIEMAPFKKQNKQIRWIRISVKELILLPLDYWDFMNDPFIVASYKKYNHLILGMETENELRHYYLGIPASYEIEHKQKAKKLGFYQFKVCDHAKDVNGEYGYWLRRV